MPNGGSDNCGTCWFNRRNHGQAGHGAVSVDNPESAYCEIREEPIEDPAYTYCANHPYRRSVRDPIPIGPIFAAEYAGGLAFRRAPVHPSPDTEEIRQHLLDLLNNLEETAAGDTYLALPKVTTIIIRQLGEFRERRAIEPLQALATRLGEESDGFVRRTLQLITEGPTPGE